MNVFILLGLGLLGFGVYQESTRKKGAKNETNSETPAPATKIINPVEQPKET